MEFGFEDGPPDSLPSVATPAAPAGFPAATTGATPVVPSPDGGQAATMLGLADPELDDLKDAAKVEILRAQTVKRPKLTHGHFFDDDKGLKKVLRTFPKIKFKGKGNEFDDLKVLVRNFERWYKELYPFGKDFEDSVWEMRRVLQEKVKDDEGIDSDPHEKLHLLRFQYKNTPAPSEAVGAVALSEEQRRRIEENRRRALEKKQQREAGDAGASSSRLAFDSSVDMETQFRVAENRARALQRKAEKEAAARGQSAGADMDLGPPDDFMDEEDVFGYGSYGMEESSRAPPPPQQQVSKASQAAASSSHTFPEDEDDVFGFGGGFGEEDEPTFARPAQQQPRSAPPDSRTQLETSGPVGAGLTAAKGTASTVLDSSARQQAATTMMEEDDDVFGFGGGLDDEDSPPRPSPPAAAAPPAAAQVRAPQISQAAGPGTTAPEDEDDIFGFGGGLDDPMGAPPARPQVQHTGPSTGAPTFLEDDGEVFGFGPALDNPPDAVTALEHKPPQVQQTGPSTGAPTFLEDDGDVFGFGPALDNPPDAVTALEHKPPAAAAEPTSAPRPQDIPVPDDDDDIFGFGAGLDDEPPMPVAQVRTQLDAVGNTVATTAKEGTAPTAACETPTAAQPKAAAIDLDEMDDDDPFGFGGGVD